MGTYHRCLASDRLGLRRALIADDKTRFFGFIREKTKQGHVCTIHHGFNGLYGLSRAGRRRAIFLLSFLPTHLFSPFLLLSYLPIYCPILLLPFLCLSLGAEGAGAQEGGDSERTGGRYQKRFEVEAHCSILWIEIWTGPILETR